MKIGIYGGSFNPPHLGHIYAARAAINALGLDKLLLMPAFRSPDKDVPETAAEHRINMLSLAAGEKMEVSTLELDRGGISYTVDTLTRLRQDYPQDELYLCMGSDMFSSFLGWKQPEEMVKLARLCVFRRGDPGEAQQIAGQKAVLEQMGASVLEVEHPLIRISSTDLRRLLVFDCAGPFMDPAVLAYIKKNGLYGTGEDYKNLPMDKLEAAVIRLLNPNRVRHVLGCRDTAAELARIWGTDEEDAARAGMLHDVTKALPGFLQLTLCDQYDIMLDGFFSQNPKTLHATTGALVAKRIFGEKDTVVAAIDSHTTGKAGMNTLEKIIYVADYMEPNRDFPGVEELRGLAYTDLDKALKLGLEMTLAMLKSRGSDISPGSQQALQWLESIGV